MAEPPNLVGSALAAASPVRESAKSIKAHDSADNPLGLLTLYEPTDSPTAE